MEIPSSSDIDQANPGRRPSVIQHLPALDAPQHSYSERPKVLLQGPRTNAVPFKEHKHYRRVSDSIGNNYSPLARDLSTALIYKLKLASAHQSHDKHPPLDRRHHIQSPIHHHETLLRRHPPAIDRSPKPILIAATADIQFNNEIRARKQSVRVQQAQNSKDFPIREFQLSTSAELRRKRLREYIGYDISQEATQGSVHSESAPNNRAYSPAKNHKMPHFDFERKPARSNGSRHSKPTKESFYLFTNAGQSSDKAQRSNKEVPTSPASQTRDPKCKAQHGKKMDMPNSEVQPEASTSVLSTAMYRITNQFVGPQRSFDHEENTAYEASVQPLSEEKLAKFSFDPKNFVENKGQKKGLGKRRFDVRSYTSGVGTGSVGTVASDSQSESSTEFPFVSDDDVISDDSEEEEGLRVHDEATQATLNVEFPPYTFSTHGLSRPATPEPDSIPRYYSVMETSIEGSMISSLPSEWWQKSLKFLKRELVQMWPALTDNLIKEINLLHKRSMKKAVMDYILLDPKEQERLGVQVPFTRSNSAGRWRYPWYESLNRARRLVKTNLYINHSVNAKILYQWESRYSTFRLLNIPNIYSLMPLTVEELKHAVERSSQEAAEILTSRWIEECAEIVREKKESVEAAVSEDDEVARMDGMDHFFGCLATLMSNIIRELVRKSIQDVVFLLEQYRHGNKYEQSYEESGLHLPAKPHPIKFFMRPDMTNVCTTFEPAFDKIIEKLHEIVDVMVTSVQQLPRVEHLLFQAVENASATHLSAVQTEDEIVVVAKQRISAVILHNSYGPTRYRGVYEPIYGHLLNGKTDRKVQQFIEREPPLRSYVKELEKLKAMARSTSSLPVNVPMHLFLLDCKQLNQWLLDRSHHLQKMMIDNVMNISRRFNRSICTTYDEIVKRITSHVESTNGLVELQEYVDNLASNELIKLKEQLGVAASNLLFLMDYAHLSKDDVLLNDNTFSWPDRIIPIMRNSEQRLQKEHDLKVSKLKTWQRGLEKRLADVAAEVKEFQKKERMGEAHRYLEILDEIQAKIHGFMEEKQQVNREEMLLDVGHVSPYPQIQEITSKKEPFEKLWRNVVAFNKMHDKWMNGPLLEVNAEVVDENVQELWKTSYKLTKRFQHPDLMGPLKAATSIKNKLEKFRINMPLINALCNPGIKQRHWDLMSLKVGYDMTPSSGTALSEMLRMKLEKHLEELTHISNQARKEHALEKALTKMKDDWELVHFGMVPYRDSDVQILSAVDDIQMLLDDHVVKTHTMKGSPFITPFLDEIDEWENTLQRSRDIIDSWLVVQAAWLYLEPIFGSEDIRNQIPTEGKMFTQVDGHFKEVMLQAAKNTKAMSVLAQPGMLEILQDSQGLLESIQKGLNEYLEKKRIFFPRFFFLSNDELLEILSETRDPLRVQPHLKKCFEGIASLVFTEEKEIVAMQSAEGEKVDLIEVIQPSEARGLVERWLSEVEEVMKLSIREETSRAVDAYPQFPFKQWCLQWPGQVILATSNIYWTAEVTQAIRDKGGLKRYLDVCTSHIDDIIQLVRGKLSKMDRVTLGALVTIDVHARDVVAGLADDGVSDPRDFNWIAQMRYYWEDDAVMVRMISTTVPYGYEYLGNTGRLVITPLTERCYRTLMGALQLNLGGAPEGPAGTGKTESCKDLAKAVAKQCVVFNCSDGLDYKAMGKFFKGLAQSGAWACFDEFNRIDLEVLSVVAQQIQTIQRAVADQVIEFVFEGTQISLDPSCTIFITMNPGYAGRAELPDNLKVLFRTVAMMIPDYALIAEISLYSMGFVDARSLAAKIVATYRLCSEQLSSQHHYDYGMRAVKSVLTTAGNLKLKYIDQREDELMLRAITDVNLPKFLAHDIPLFDGIISDLFPGVKLPKPDHGLLEKAIRNNIASMHLQPIPWFIEKIIQLHEMMKVRHGFMVVGKALGGKTTCYKVLTTALEEVSVSEEVEEQPVRYRVINPKAVTMALLYGSFDPVSHEWSDGILANTFREHATSTDAKRKWLIFDGPVDAVWVENLNTVLDDNKKLCLMSGEIIAMNSQQNMMFEVENLEQASPATVSRCGMIYMDPDELGTTALITSWLQMSLPENLTKQQKDTVRMMFNWLVPPCTQFVLKQCQHMLKLSAMHMTVNLIKLYSCLLKELGDLDSGFDENESGSLYSTVTEDTQEGKISASDIKVIEERGNMLVAHFLFAIVWSIGACLEENSRERFNDFFRELLDSDGGKMGFPRPRELRIPRNLLIPKRGSVFDYVWIKKTYGSWHKWGSLTKTPELTESTKEILDGQLNSVIIETVDTYRQEYFLRKFISSNMPILFIGPTGTGKSAITNGFLRALPKRQCTVCNVNFSAHTSASHTQDLIFSKLDRRRKGVYGPTPGKRMIVFVDDLNMPAKERYGAQPPIELLRQWVDHGHWYDTKDTSMLTLIDMTMTCAMAPPGGGRNEITERFLRHFNIISIHAFDDETMKTIFQPMLDWHFTRGFDNALRRFGRILIWATTDVYTQTMSRFLPTPGKSHYLFNLRDYARVIQGILLFRGERCPEGVPGALKLARLWVHEVYRVFYDRLVDDEDRKKFFGIVKVATTVHFKEKMNIIFEHLIGQKGGRKDVTEAHIRSVFFGDYMSPKMEDGVSERLYDEVTDMTELRTKIEHYLDDYNTISKAPLDLVMFQFAIEHISRISRILKQPNGHALLVGIGGSGRQSSARIAAFMAEYELFQVNVTKSYSVNDWRSDLKKVLRRAGEDLVPTVFLFGDYQIKDEAFLEDINLLLNTGDIPNIFENEERLEIIDKMQRLTQAENDDKAEITPLNMYSKFIERVNRSLHMVLAFSPVGEAFRTRLRNFPSLINCCTIDWFQAWPDDALEMVANHFLDDVEMGQSMRQEAVQVCKLFHQDVRSLSERYFESLRRRTYITPTSYLELIKTFKRLLQRKRLDLLTFKNRYVTGLEKLEFAESQINIMQQDLTALQPQLENSSLEVEALVANISAESAEVEIVKKVVEADEAVAAAAAEAAQNIKQECEEKLAVAMPAMNAAIAALNTLRQQDIALVKTMSSPPTGVKLTMEAICILKGLKPERKTDGSGRAVDDYWPAAKKMLGDLKFLDSLRDYDKDNIPIHVMKKIRERFIGDTNFRPEIIRNVSSACEGLCSWVLAIEVYDRVAKVVAPKRQSLLEAEDDLAREMGLLQVKRNELQEVTDKLELLNDNLRDKMAEKKRLEDNIELTKVKLIRAEKLISGLGGEKERWTELTHSLESTYHNIVGDVLLSSGIVAYLAPFTPLHRQETLKKWWEECKARSIPVSEVFSLENTLGDRVQIMEWQLAGLPKDNSSVDNAIIVNNASRWPLMIDPQGQASKWVKNMERKNNLHVCKVTDKDYLRTLENCIQFGNPILIENVPEDLDPVLEPVLLRQTFKQSGMEYIKLGENTIQYSHDFKLYISTRMRNPHYLPEVSVKVTLINFMITPIGLEDQLLCLVAAKERPELEEQKNELILEGAKNKRLLKDIEDKILEVLAREGNILEDETAIRILSESRELSSKITEKQEITSRTEQEIDHTRNGYKPVAIHSSVLFFVISDLAYIDPMYQYSLWWFINLYTQSIDQSVKSSNLEERITNLKDHFTKVIYGNVCRSLFEKDKLLFSFLLCIGILKAKAEVDDSHWRFLLTGGIALENPFPNPAPKWLSEKSWAEIVRLDDIPAFTGIMPHVRMNTSSWKIFYDSSTPHIESFPAPWDNKLSDLETLVVLRCIRPDKIVPAVQDFIVNKMGAQYIEPPPFDLHTSYEDSDSSTPLIFILSPGADPMASLMKFAEEKGMIEQTGTQCITPKTPLSRRASLRPRSPPRPLIPAEKDQEAKTEHKPPSARRGVGRRKSSILLPPANENIYEEDNLGINPHQTEEDMSKEVSRVIAQLLQKQQEDKKLYSLSSGMQTISLGQGQGPIAERMIERARSNGTWVVLQNCHLAVSWLPELRRICEEAITDKATTKDEFRLWLTSYPSPEFPVSVLQNGVKMTNEPPKGLRANLFRSYMNDPISDAMFFNACDQDGKGPTWKNILFALCFFHALVQERKKFGPLGWNIPYGFNESDLRISIRQAQMFLKDYDEVPLVALKYLIGECNYGGRVTDDHDRRLLQSLLCNFLCQEVYQTSSYKFTSSPLYYNPSESSYEAYILYIKSLPLNTHPEVFGFHENADISKDQQETQQMFDGILVTLPKQTMADGGKSPQLLVQELASDILSKLPDGFKLQEVQAKYPTDYSESMNTVLAQELIRFNRLTAVVRSSLQDLQRALRGLVLLSVDLEDVLDNMLVGKVPSLWAAKSYPSLKPLGSYVSDLIARLQFFKTWVTSGKPIIFWISGFFFTQSFLTGTMQNYARKRRIPIDQLTFGFHVTSDPPKTHPNVGVYIHGLYMEGARWDCKEKTIAESFKKILYDPLPVIWLEPTDLKQKKDGQSHLYECPVYKTSSRRGVLSTTGHSTNYVLTINFPCGGKKQHWVNRGVACLCQLDD
ncbi:dynein axonemal heavy chain 3-like isoform X3 [Clavelina lepadiformis]|uniref:dynein axonemal heavy chain 3-like isoform X3 n=1 Tax=Clavelina lepadiformis TaxID=159417 RepID=UPI004042EE46